MIQIIVILLLLLCNGLFAMYEMALVACSKPRLETIKGKGDKRAAYLLTLLERPENTLSTIQIGITLIGIVSGAYGGMAFVDKLTPVLQQYATIARYAADLSYVIIIGSITYASLVIGELVPKTLALHNPEKYALFLSPLIRVITVLSFPFVWLLSKSTKLINQLLGVKGGEERQLTEEELKFILKRSSEEGVIDKQETEMIKEVFRFSDKRVGDLMTHRKNVIALREDYTLEEINTIVEQYSFTKYPVLDAQGNNVVGVVYVKDLFSALCRKNFKFQDLIRPALFVPEHVMATRILDIFREESAGFAVIINEYGLMEGVVTVHDLTESVLGDFPDDGEQYETDIVVRQDGSLLVDGEMNYIEFFEEMGLFNIDEVSDAGFSTLSGLAMYKLNRIPKVGDKFRCCGFAFEVIDMDGARVDKLLVERIL